MDIISSRYAESLFDLAKEEQAVETYQKDMLKIQTVFQDESLVKFFSHVALQDEVKIEVLKKSFESQVSTYVFNFMLLLIKRRRMKYIETICYCFESLCNEYFGIKIGKIYSAYDLLPEEIVRIEDVMSEKEDRKVKLKMIKDESLIGGIKVEIDNHIYDDSLSYRLESLKRELLRK